MRISYMGAGELKILIEISSTKRVEDFWDKKNKQNKQTKDAGEIDCLCICVQLAMKCLHIEAERIHHSIAGSHRVDVHAA